MIVVGVDENGLGPLLGPLVATAVTLDVDDYQAQRLRRIGERIGLHDSKQTAGFGQMAWTESVALSLLAGLHGKPPETFDELLSMISLDTLDTLVAPCPSSTHGQCWSHALRLPLFGGDVARGAPAWQRLTRAGVKVTHVRTALACAGRLNASYANGGTRLSMDLSLFERLLLDARAQRDINLHAICGMVGGIREYPAHFTLFARDTVNEGEHSHGRREYQVAGLGGVAFVVDADASHLPVGIASMVGKYVRELSMERQNRFYREHDSSLKTGSGYHDPVTKRFVAQSADLRRRLNIVDACFAR